jgi:hypothetical protein
MKAPRVRGAYLPCARCARLNQDAPAVLLPRPVWMTDLIPGNPTTLSGRRRASSRHQRPTTAGADASVGPALRNRGPELQGSGPVAELAPGRTANPRMPPQRKDRAGSRRCWAVHAMGIDGARRRSHEPIAVRPELRHGRSRQARHTNLSSRRAENGSIWLGFTGGP